MRTWSWRSSTTGLGVLALVGLVGACSNGGGSEPDLSAAQEAELATATEFVRCLREEGIEDLPDPQVNEDGFMITGAPFEDEADDFMAAQEACQHVFDDGDGNGEEPEEPGPHPDPDPATWQEVTPGGDCQCSDGSEFNLWVREASPEKVVLYLEDGGACFSAETCDPANELYNVSITEGPDGEGIFDFDREGNPFADHSVVYVPYCTADVFLGNAATEYAPGLTVQHKGSVNGTAALDHLVAAFPAATDVVVLGESAGSVGAPLYGGLVADRLPEARVTVLADSSGSYPGAPEITGLVSSAWGVDNAIPDWPETAGLTAEQWSSFPGLFARSGRHDPGIVFARHDYAYDEHQASWFPHVGLDPGDLLARIDANEAEIEAAGVGLASYIAPGEEHTVLTEDRFYTEEVDGRPLVTWVAELIAGDPVDDVHCAECAAG